MQVVTGLLQGLAGGLGAGGGELAARYIAKELFPNKDVSELTEREKQQVSALSQLASGLAGGLTTGDMAGAITGSQAGKNAVESNFFKPTVLPTDMADYGQSVSSLAVSMAQNDGSIEEINAELYPSHSCKIMLIVWRNQCPANKQSGALVSEQPLAE
ncbi:hypothetical protein GWI73_11715 [Proteus sp. G2661]|nr:hypothetical protein [Proteus sp. G2661]